MRLATTTSLRDSGLLDTLLPKFEQKFHCRVDVVAVGTGAAIKLGEAGDADVLLVHARDAEVAFMNAGHGSRHEEFMYNEFLILGPATDPARIRELSPLDALKQIAVSRHPFVSRGDDSGTHQRERELWNKAGGLRSWADYLESGQGMGPTLMMADELQGYVLTDQGTYLNFRQKVDLVPLVANSPLLRNPYAVIVVNPQKHEHVNATLANALAEFLIDPETQRDIGDYRIGNQTLFQPTRLPAP